MEKDNNNIKPVSIRYNEDGQPDGVRIRTLDEDFTIALHDACDHDLTADEARALGQAMTLKQANILCAYLDEVQQTLEDAGGDRLGGWYVTCADCLASSTWFFASTYGCFLSNSRSSHGFRSRPGLASCRYLFGRLCRPFKI